MSLIKLNSKALFIYFFLPFFSLANDSVLTNSDILFKQATDFVKSKNYEEAILIFEKLAKNSEHDACNAVTVRQFKASGAFSLMVSNDF